MNYLETYFTCSGMCKTPNFYVYLDNAVTGPPSDSCVPELQEEWASYFAGLWVVFLIVALVSVVVLLFTPCLFCKIDDSKKETNDEDEDEDEPN
mmetsp:Transcript_94251/g.129823  ORF Transcript_94251/g.129823 Transcript_94251/m.129823 type:complete len:94 (+) Transcript_94251:717-998(+)